MRQRVKCGRILTFAIPPVLMDNSNFIFEARPDHGAVWHVAFLDLILLQQRWCDSLTLLSEAPVDFRAMTQTLIEVAGATGTACHCHAYLC